MKASLPEPTSPVNPIPERRSGLDRRLQRGIRSLFNSRRRRRSAGRRRHDRGYVDIYDRGSWGIALAVMAMSFVDATLTVLQIGRGAVREANPLMNVALARGGIFVFFSLKASMTAFPLAVIILHKEWSLARYMARLCFWFYILILLYHLYLIWGYTGASAPIHPPF